MLQKIIKTTLIITGFILTVSLLSNTFDGDFGWHLRFGQDAVNGNFQYIDSYTWPYFGKSWTNHEWGGDVLFWIIYSTTGYFPIILIISASIWGAFLLIQKIFINRLTISGLLISIGGIASLKFLLVPRLAFLVLILLAVLWLSLERLPKHKSYYLWPPLIWLWSALHGSWVLAFIFINIYLGGNIIFLLIRKRISKLAGKDTGWSWAMIFHCLFWQLISAATLIANPYGFKIWTEVGGYFTDGYFKQIITEWVPSYSYPVYVWPLAMAAVATVFIILGWLKKRATLSQLLIFAAIFYAAWKFKRNNIYLVLASVPVLTAVLIEARQRLVAAFKKYSTLEKYFSAICSFAIIAAVFFFFNPIRFNNHIWSDKELLSRYPFPVEAVNFLINETEEKQIYLFNEFRWGGYLNWVIPSALVYLDGRGTATWEYNGEETMLEHYRKIKYQAGGFAELEKSPAEYAILSTYWASYKKPDLINRIIFGNEAIAQVLVPDPPQLEKMLRRSDSWKIIYEDNIAIIWKKIKPSVPE